MNSLKLARSPSITHFVRGAVSKPSKDITILPVEKDNFNRVLDHVTPIFMKEEPLSHSFPPCTTGKREDDFRKFAETILQSGLSFMALDGTKVVGACLNRKISRDYVFNFEIRSKEADEDPLNYSVSRMIMTIHKQLDLFTAAGVDCILDIGVVSTEPSHRGIGLAYKLICASLELGAREDMRVAKADCTGPSSAAVFHRVGMKEVFKFPYDEYKIDGEIVFKNNPKRGLHCSVMACKLQNSEPYVLPLNLT